MPFCAGCDKQVQESARFCPNCGRETRPASQRQPSEGEQVLGTVLFGGYYKDICFTDLRIIQFEPMKVRWKFLAQPLGLKPLIVEKGGVLGDVLPFAKIEVPLGDVSSIEVKNHSLLKRGYINVVKRSGEVVELTRLDVEVDKTAFEQLTGLISSVYPGLAKIIR